MWANFGIEKCQSMPAEVTSWAASKLVSAAKPPPGCPSARLIVCSGSLLG